MDDFKGLWITQLDDYDENEEVPVEPITVDEFDEDDDEEEDCEPVMLGFVESPRFEWSNLRQLFPSLAGGFPAWLDPVNLPSGNSILCDLCEEPLRFLLQTQLSIGHYFSSCVHLCLRDQHEQWKRNPEKAKRRPRVNPFYLSEAPKHDGTDEPLGLGSRLCTWCGTWKGDKLCSGCKNAGYYSPKHQALHWRSGHKTEFQQVCAVIESSDSGLVASLVEKQKG